MTAQTPDKIPAITPAEVQSKLDQGWSLVDVRRDDEWAAGHLEGAVHIPLDQLVDRVAEVPDKAVVYCHAGGRSARATGFLVSQGREAVNLDGGITEWTAEGHPVVS